MIDLEELRRLALAAIEGDERAPGEWEAYYTTHGDPYVVERGRAMFGVVATVSTAPEDYGRDRAAFMAACDPVTILALIDRLEAQADAALEAAEAADRRC